MIVEFKVTNFRSIREEQTLSLMASNYDKQLSVNLIHPNLAGLSRVKLLKGAAIYGANASGKSNVLSALHFMAEFVKDSAIKIAPDDSTGTVPFCLDPESLKKPSHFEITAVIEGIRYVYGFSLDKERIHREFLEAYPKGTAQKWFERNYNAKTQKYSWESRSSYFKLDKSLYEKTRVNSLFLSTGAQFNNAQLMTVYNWIKKGIRYFKLDGESPFAPILTAILCEKDQGIVKQVVRLLQLADFGIIDADVSHKEISLEAIRDQIPPGLLRKIESEANLSSLRMPLIKFKHHASGMDGQTIDFKEESDGTKRFFSLVGPWLEILRNGYTVLVDELETSLHPVLVKEFLKLFFCEENNPKGAQVVFTTHNPILLDTEFIRRDQVWFTEKDEHGATHLYPLTDYNARNAESLVRGYLAGRYGALPFIPKGLKTE